MLGFFASLPSKFDFDLAYFADHVVYVIESTCNNYYPCLFGKIEMI